jgi:hypothetical protein
MAGFRPGIRGAIYIAHAADAEGPNDLVIGNTILDHLYFHSRAPDA